MCPTVDAYEGHCFWFKPMCIVGVRGVGMVLEGITWKMRKYLDVRVDSINWFGLLVIVGV